MHEETSSVPVNFAFNKPAQQSSTHYANTAKYAVDGDFDTYSRTDDSCDNFAWWTVDLQNQVIISQILCYLKKNVHQYGFYENFKVETRTSETDDWMLCWNVENPVPPIYPYVVKCTSKVTVARYVRISVSADYILFFDFNEVIVNGVSKPGKFLMRQIT